MLEKNKHLDISSTETADDRPSVKTIVLAAIELEGRQRQRYVDEACKHDHNLSRQVNDLLELHEQAKPSMLDQDFGQILAIELNAADETTFIGKNHNGAQRSFALGAQLGAGSFGKVFLAQQTAPVDRTVAVKLLHKADVPDTAVQRFLAEHRAQAVMSHPNIARMLDAGKTDQGQPFLVIEYVDGCEITEYCQRLGLGFHERLKIFTDVCRAVQHAHQKGVIHRDLKPSNILVTTIDDAPVPKVIDFGVAKVLRHQESLRQLTEDGQFVGSLAYMSPEQARADADIDTSSDIYGLGVLLYQLLTGRLPFGCNDKNELLAPLELLKQICEAQPLAPWLALQETAKSGGNENHPSPSGHDRQRLHAALRGDLGWIVMKCLEKERTHRYASVGNLIDDIENHLNNRPVTAGAPSRRYLLRKFTARNQSAITLCTVIFLAIIFSVVGMLTAAQAQRKAAHQEMIAAHEKELGATASMMSEELKLVLGEMVFITSRLKDDQSRNVLIAAMDRVSQRLETAPNTNALIESKMHRVLGLAFTGVKDYLSAEKHLLTSIEIEKLAGRENQLYRLNKLALAQVYKSDMQSGKAEKLVVEVRELQEVGKNVGHQETVDALALLASIYNSRKNHLQALDFCNRMKKFAGKTDSLSPNLQAKIYFLTAETNFQLQRYEAAKADLKKLFGLENIDQGLWKFRRARYQYTLAKTHLVIGDFEDAAALTDEAWGAGNLSVEANLRLIELKTILLLRKKQFALAKEFVEQGLRVASANATVEFLEQAQKRRQSNVLVRLSQLCDRKSCTETEFNELRDLIVESTIADDDHLALIRLPLDRDGLQ